MDCTVTLASGHALTSLGPGGDAHVAFDMALEKIAKRVRRYKNRLKDHHGQARAKQAESAANLILAAPDADYEDEAQDHGDDGLSEPMVIAETENPVRNMTVSMAVKQLDLTEAQTIVFKNAAHGGLSVVYCRPDGNIGWIDPERTRGVDAELQAGTAH